MFATVYDYLVLLIPFVKFMPSRLNLFIVYLIFVSQGNHPNESNISANPQPERPKIKNKGIQRVEIVLFSNLRDSEHRMRSSSSMNNLAGQVHTSPT